MRKSQIFALLAGLLLVLSTALLTLVPAASAFPGSAARAPAATIEDAAQALREDPVYVDPGARDQLSTGQEKALEDRITKADKPVFVAVLPDGSAFPEDGLLATLRNDTGITGVYAVRLGDGFDAGADPQVMPVRAVDNLTAAVKAPAADTSTDAQLDAFVDGALEQAKGTAPASWDGDGNGSSAARSTGTGLLVLAGVAVAGAAGAYAVMRRNRRRARAEESAALDKLRTVVDEDITAYGETLERLDFHPGEPGADEAMRADYEHALDSYESAKSSMEKAERPADVRPVTQALEDGRYSLAVLEARRTGSALPDRRPPCFFDPRHGPSVADMRWRPAAPPPGRSRCAPPTGPDWRTARTR